MWVGQHAHIQDDIGINGRTFFESKGLNLDRQRVGFSRINALTYDGTLLVGRHFAGINNEVSGGRQRFQQPPLDHNGLAQRTTIFTKGVFTTGLVEAFAQCLRSRVKENELQFQALAKCFQIVPEIGNPSVLGPDIDADC